MAAIKEDYVSFETAKLLKEKGFNEACNRIYQGPNLKYTTLPISPLMSLGELGGFHPKQLYVNNNELGDIVYTAPTLQMAMKWLREVHKIIPIILTGEYSQKPLYYWFRIDTIIEEKLKDAIYREDEKEYSSYEEACEAAIKYCCENLI